jgi:hypothetical protein
MAASTAACKFCGTVAPVATMEMTGHGLRCNACTMRATFDAFSNPDNDMGQHLTRPELERVASSGGSEIVLGIVTTIGAGFLLVIFTLVLAPRGIAVAAGGVLLGVSTAAHGAYRRGKARRALKRA